MLYPNYIYLQSLNIVMIMPYKMPTKTPNKHFCLHPKNQVRSPCRFILQHCHHLFLQMVQPEGSKSGARFVGTNISTNQLDSPGILNHQAIFQYVNIVVWCYCYCLINLETLPIEFQDWPSPHIPMINFIQILIYGSPICNTFGGLRT